jgi:hypothetical protein
MKASRPLLMGSVLLLISICSEAQAQFPRYRPPAGNPLPNELNYFRRDVGILDPYNTFVDPQQQLSARLQSMAKQEQSNYRSSQQALSQLRALQTAPTGVSGGFMNLSHYYSRSSSQPGRRR